MRRALAPLLFDDHDQSAAEAQRASVVQKAERSLAARTKAATKKTDDGFVVHSFRDLIAQLGTIVQNRMRRPGAAEHATFAMTTRPTPQQRRALELLGVPAAL